ncbi:MAG: FAD-binding oxidoreductase [Promethearchaeota archaeon]
MKRNYIIQELLEEILWEDFFNEIESHGFIKFPQGNFYYEISNCPNKEILQSGKLMFINNIIQGGAIRDVSYLHLLPHVVFQPKTETQLHDIVVTSQKYKIPITFTSGKTGLSGAFANYAIIVDLANLHSFFTPFQIDIEKESVFTEQGVLVSDLIKWVSWASKGEYIFPVQPSSALKLPVRVGGIIATNASGLTSGKLGSTKDWVEYMRIMKPNGEIVQITKSDSIFHEIIGGEGQHGIVLAASFKLCKAPKNATHVVLYGSNLEKAFEGLHEVQKLKIFPLISEFIISPLDLTEKFKDYFQNHDKKEHEMVEWMVLLKGTSNLIHQFIEIMKNHVNLKLSRLNDSEFSNLLKERASISLNSYTEDPKAEVLKIPGFEDILLDPKNVPRVFNFLNSKFKEKGFERVILGYGHLNFRKGQGALLHFRLPVPIRYFFENKKSHFRLLAEVSHDIIISLKEKYHVKVKAEHGTGPFKIWIDPTYRKTLRKKIEEGNAFYNPHLKIFDKLVEYKIQNKISGFSENTNHEERFKDHLEKEIFIDCMSLYLSNGLDC